MTTTVSLVSLNEQVVYAANGQETLITKGDSVLQGTYIYHPPNLSLLSSIFGSTSSSIVTELTATRLVLVDSLGSFYTHDVRTLTLTR
jgi:hypothetical protein